MIVVYCADRSLYTILPTAINSLLSNNPQVAKIYLLIEDDSIPYIADSRIQFINCNNISHLIRTGFNCTHRFPYMAMVRCFLTKIIPDSRILYLDCDTIVDANIDSLWQMNLRGNCLAARYENCRYFNSGVLLMDLQLMQALKQDEQVIHLLRTCHLVFPDQDALNIVYRNSVLRLEHKFNAIGDADRDHVYDSDICIRHFPGVVKPWKQGAHPQDIAIWNKYKVNHI